MIYKFIDEKFELFIINIKEYFKNRANTILFDKRNIIKIVEYNEKKYIVKSFKIPHLLNQIIYRFFRASKAQRSYENTVKLQDLNINTPYPVGYIEFTTLLQLKESFYVSEFFDYDFEIRAVFKDEAFSDRKNILKKFIEFTYEIHNKGVYHIDYSPGNILIKKVDNEYKFSIIDVNRMKFLQFDNDLRMKSLMKLTNNPDDNKFMAEYYAKIANMDESVLFDTLQFYLDEQQKYLDNKKRLKKLRGQDGR